MAIWDFRPRGDVLTGLLIGAGVVAAPVALPLAWTAVRPLLKVILKSGFMLYETGRRAFAEDLVGTDREKPEKAQAVTAETVQHREEKTSAVKPVPTLRVEESPERKSKKNPETPAPVKPKRRAKTAKKKSDKEN
jgi:hypothetical protein